MIFTAQMCLNYNNMKKVAFKGDGTAKTGEKIISLLEQMGGKNKHGYWGVNPWVYCIGHNGNISTIDDPSGYTIADPHTYKPSEYPKKMWVSDISEEDAREYKDTHTVVGDVEMDGVQLYIVREGDLHSTFRYVVDIPEDVEVTKEEIAAWKGCKVEQLIIK
jgi:hypothetical protein